MHPSPFYLSPCFDNHQLPSKEGNLDTKYINYSVWEQNWLDFESHNNSKIELKKHTVLASTFQKELKLERITVVHHTSY